MSSPEIPNLPAVLLVMNAEVCPPYTVWNVRGLEDTGYWSGLHITKGKKYIHSV